MTLTDLRSFMLADAAVASLFGVRIYPLAMRQGTTKPAAALTVVSDVPGATLCGNTETRNARVQVDVYASASASADAYTNAEAAVDVIAARMRQAAGFTALELDRQPSWEDETEEVRITLIYSLWSDS